MNAKQCINAEWPLRPGALAIIRCSVRKKKMASLRLLLVLAFTATLYVLGEAEMPPMSSCSKEEVYQCVSSLMWNETQTTPSTPMDTERFCDMVKEAEMCVWARHCRPKDEGFTKYLVIRSVNEAYKHLCATKCNTTKIEDYIPKYPQVMMDVYKTVENCEKETFPDKLNEKSNSTKCQTYNKHFKCVYKKINETYPKLSFAILVGGLTAAHRPFYKKFGCMLGGQEDRCCPIAMGYCNAKYMSITPAVNKTGFEKFCGKLVDIGQCYHAIKCRRDSPGHQKWQSHVNVTKGNMYYCSGPAKKEVLKDYACLDTAYMKYRKDCNKTIEPNPSNASVCKAANEKTKCMYDGIARDCSPNGAHVIMTVHVGVSRPKMHMKYNCKLKCPDQCNPIAIGMCAEKVHRVKMPKMPEDFDHRFCWDLKEGAKCFENIMCNKTDRNFTDWQGLRNHTKGRMYKCKEGLKGAIIKDYKCVTEEFDKSMKKCNKTFDNKPPPPRMDDKTLCGFVNNMTKCMYEAIDKKCDQRAAAAVIMSHIKSKQPRMKLQHSCQLVSDFLPMTAGVRAVAVADMSAIFMSTLAILLTLLARRD